MELIDYIFQFPSQASAQFDAVVGPYFSSPTQGFDVLIFDRSKNSALPLPNYWVMVSQQMPINSALFNHPNIALVINRSQQILGNASVLLDVSFPDTSVLSIMISGRGQHTAAGLFGVGQFKPTPLDGLIAEDGITFLIAEDGVTFLVQE